MAIKRETSSPPPYPGIPRSCVSTGPREPQDVPRSSSPTTYPGIPRMSPHNQKQGEAASIQECQAKDPDVGCSGHFSKAVTPGKLTTAYPLLHSYLTTFHHGVILTQYWIWENLTSQIQQRGHIPPSSTQWGARKKVFKKNLTKWVAKNPILSA